MRNLAGAGQSGIEQRFGVDLLDGSGITATATMAAMNYPGNVRAPG